MHSQNCGAGNQISYAAWTFYMYELELCCPFYIITILFKVKLRRFQFVVYIASNRWMNNELEMIWSKTAVVWWRYYVRICLDSLRKTLPGHPVSRPKFERNASRMRVRTLHLGHLVRWDSDHKMCTSYNVSPFYSSTTSCYGSVGDR
jgi:hypothetical protein